MVLTLRGARVARAKLLELIPQSRVEVKITDSGPILLVWAKEAAKIPKEIDGFRVARGDPV